MKSTDIFLFGKRMVPYFEERIPDIVEELEGKDPSSDTLSRWQKLKLHIYLIYKKLEARFPLPERLCTTLLSADEIHIYYSSEKKESRAAHIFRHYLAHQRSKQRFWLGVDLALSCLGGILMPLPGPNLFFYYPAARTFSHFRSWKGARKGIHLPWKFFPSEHLRDFEHRLKDKSMGHPSEVIRETAQALDLPGLNDFLKKNHIHF